MKTNREHSAGSIRFSEIENVERLPRVPLHMLLCLVDTFPEAVLVARISGEIIAAGLKAAEMQGFSNPGEMIGIDAKTLIAPEDRERVNEYMSVFLRTGGYPETEYRLLRKDGSLFWGEVNLSLAADENAIPVLIISLRDTSRRHEAEERFRNSDQSLAWAQRIAHLGNWEWNIETGELRWSEELFRLFGLEPRPESLSIERFWEFVHPEDRPRVQRAVQESLESDKFYTVEHRIVLSNGLVKLVHERGEVVRDAAGTPTHLFGTVQDISEQHRAKRELNRLASFTELNPNPIIETDPFGNVTYLNKAAGKLFPEVLFEGPSHPILKELMNTLPEFEESPVEMIVRETRVDGHVYEQDISFIPESKRLRTYIEDITARKHAEMLRENMASLKDNLMSAMLIISGELDLDAALRQMLLTARGLLKARNAVYAEVRDGAIARTIREELETGESDPDETLSGVRELLETILRDRVTIWQPNPKADSPDPVVPAGSFIGAPLIYRDEVLGLVYLTVKMDEEDFTEQDRIILENLAAHAAVAVSNARLYGLTKRFNAELEEKVTLRTRELQEALREAESANKAKSAFLASMTHELRTPLNAIVGFSQILEEDYYGGLNEKQKEFIQDILSSANHLLALINDLFEITKAGTGRIRLELTRVKLRSLLESSLLMVKTQKMKQHIDISLIIPATLEEFSFDADERKLKQVLFNLLSNAVKFTPENGRISIEAVMEGEMLSISVSDTGPGIDPIYHERIFEEFFQIGGGLVRKYPGSGLGLTIARRIVELHHGTIRVRSNGDNSGSEFIVSLPVGRDIHLKGGDA